MPLQGYKATEQELQRHLSLNELYHPVPYSFEPIKILYKGLAEALQSTMKVSLDVRLKESEFHRPTLGPDNPRCKGPTVEGPPYP